MINILIIIGLLIFIGIIVLWIYCLILQSPEEYAEVKKAALAEELAELGPNETDRAKQLKLEIANLDSYLSQVKEVNNGNSL